MCYCLPGPTLGPSLLAVLLRFYEHHLAFSSDIKGVGSSGAAATEGQTTAAVPLEGPEAAHWMCMSDKFFLSE